MSDEKKPLDHSDYECWPGGPLNYSKWRRENEPRREHRFRVGTKVRLTVECEVLELTRDCDGEPLYTLSMAGHGWGEESLELMEEK
jgi:hypothetical protein